MTYEDYDEIEIDRGIHLLQQVGPIRYWGKEFERMFTTTNCIQLSRRKIS